MRLTLPESSRRTERRPSAVLASGFVHAVGITLAVVGTGYGATVVEKPQVENIVFLPPPVPKVPTPKVPVRSPSAPPTATGVVLPTLEFPITIPTTVPEITLSTGAATPTEFGRPGDGQPVAVVPSGPSADSIYSDLRVEKPVVPLRGCEPRYPATLRQMGVEGDVVMQFVVDAGGRVEAGSVKAISGTQAQFEGSVREALSRCRFVAAEIGGVKVRQLVEQRFAFEIR